MMRIPFLISLVFCLLLLMAGTGMASEENDGNESRSITFRVSNKKADTQCLILNRTHPNFKRDLLEAPPNGCVKVIGSWSVEKGYVSVPMEITTADDDDEKPWKVIWKDLESEQWWIVLRKIEIPIVDIDDWKVKVSVHGSQKVMANLSYKF
jgi:hypothetical protein